MDKQQSIAAIAAINAQFQTAESIAVADSWDVPTVITRIISTAELAQELREFARGERASIDAPAIFDNY